MICRSNTLVRLLTNLSLFVFIGAASVVAEEVTEMSLGMMVLNVPDLDAAEAYYTDVIGFELIFSYPADRKEAIEIFMQPKNSGSATSSILGFAHLPNTPSPLPEGKSSYGRIVISTPNAKEIAARAEKAGATIRELKPEGDNGPVIIFFHDLNGYEIELYQAAE